MVRAFGGGNVTIPKRNRELLGIEDGDYVRLGVLGLLSGRVLGGLKRRFKCARILEQLKLTVYIYELAKSLKLVF